MRIAVLGYFRNFTRVPEGNVDHMYLDKKKLVTVANGNLIDPVAEAVKMPFRWRDSKRPATSDEIRAEWLAIKSNSSLAKLGHTAAAKVAKLELSDRDMGRIVAERLRANEIAANSIPALAHWAGWPADAQMGLMSMFWALGPTKFRVEFPKFQAAARDANFLGCMAECDIDETDNPGIAPRNRAQRIMFKLAARTVAEQLDPEYLHFADVPRKEWH